MTTKLVGPFAAATLAIGILVGAAGTVLVHDTSRPSMAMTDMGDMGQMHVMMSNMGGSTMGHGDSRGPVENAPDRNGSDQ
ncbi:MAG: hypothetical protein WKH68_03115 [Candidatus Limnocylindria bacterium]